MPPKPRQRILDHARTRERDENGMFPGSDPEATERLIKGRFQKGKSGNPGGRTHAMKTLRDRIGQLTGGDGQEIVDFMVTVMRGTMPPAPRGDDVDPDEPQLVEPAEQKIRFAAAEWLADRFFGKVKQTVELQPGQGEGEKPSTPPLRDLLIALDEKDRGDLERILTNFERARNEGRLALPETAVVDEEPETEN